MTGPPLTGPREDLLPRWDIFEEHLSEAAFLWSRRDRCLLSPRFDLAETGLEEARLVAHLDALAEAGDAVTRKLLVPALEEEDPEHLSTAAYVLLAQRGAEASRLLQEALGAGDTARHAAIQRALELWEGPGWVERLSPLFTAPLATSRALAVEVAAFHDEVPDADAVAALATHADAGVRRSALRSAWVLPDAVRAAFVPAALAAPEASVRLAGVELGLLGGMRTAWAACRELSRTSCPERAQAWLLLALGGGDTDLEVVLRGLDAEQSRPQALWALGFSGRLAAADACIQALRAEPLIAALAAEAFSAITGLPIEGRHAVPHPEEAPELPPLEEEDLDADLTPKPERDLPLPAPDTIAAWWRSARKQFEPQTRYLLGQPFSKSVLLSALTRAPMRRRHALALELALRSGGALRVQTRGRVPRQHREQQAVARSPLRISGHSFDALMSR